MNNIIRVDVSFHSVDVYRVRPYQSISEYRIFPHITITEYIPNDDTANYRLWESIRLSRFDILTEKFRQNINENLPFLR